jgi:flavin-dependent dehydrogenase
MMQPKDSYDVVVIGGGPGGSTTATLLADYGHSVGLLERARFPRHHIGESLMPQTYFTFKRIGMLEKLKSSDFPLKESVQFINASGQESQPYFFPDRDPGEWSTTWQVPRDEFDKMMLDNARAHGVEAFEGVAVREVLFDGDRAVGVRAVIDGASRDIGAKVVVDATGVAALLSKQLAIREPDPGLKNAAIYAYYKNAQRDEGRNAGATLVIHTPDKQGWFWFIPLPDNINSVGIVAKPSYLFTGRGDDPLTTLEEEIANCPGIRRRLEKSERVSHAYVTSDFTYRARRVAGDGWVLVGDAFGFLDPIYSSGVFLALKMGEFAADAIHDGLQADDLSGERLGVFGPKLAGGIQLIRQLVYAFYSPEFSFGAFSKRNPEYHDHIVRLLIGDVFHDDVAEVFEAMRDWVDLPAPVPLEGSVSVS